MNHITRCQRALGVISAHVRAEGHVQPLIVVFPHGVPVGGVWRWRAAGGHGVADLSGLLVRYLPDVFALGIGLVKLHGESQMINKGPDQSS